MNLRMSVGTYVKLTDLSLPMQTPINKPGLQESSHLSCVVNSSLFDLIDR